MASNSDLGPLPQMHKNTVLEQQSIKALNALLQNDETFLLRDERVTDFGVDGSLEVVANGCATNIRAQIQIKAIRNDEPNKDGSRSKDIEVSNLNYLLNGPSPLYFLYVATTNTFYYAWAVDEDKRIREKTPNWMSQQTITLHFNAVFALNRVSEISQRILREASLQRSVREHAISAANNEPVHIAISPKTLQTTDPKKAYEIIHTTGLTAVTNGFATQVLGLADLLAFDERMNPRIQLICGYAWFCLGRFQMTLGSVGEALARISELDESNTNLLLQIRDAAECQTGKITREEFLGRLQQSNDSATGLTRVSDRINRLRFEYLHEHDLNKREAKLSDLKAAVEEVCAGDNLRPYKLQARIFLAFCEGERRTRKIITEFGVLRIAREVRIGNAAISTNLLEAAFSDCRTWEGEMETLIQDCHRLGVPLVTAEALRTRLFVRTAYLNGLHFATKFFGYKRDDEAFSTIFSWAQTDGQQALTMFHDARHIEGELRTKNNIATLLELGNDLAGSKRLASEVLPIAKGMGLTDLAEEAMRLVNGNTPLRDLHSNHRKDNMGSIADSSDEDIRNVAETYHKAMQLPQDRLKMMLVEIEALRYAAKLQRVWCKHLVLIEDLRHTESTTTAYALPITFFGRCQKHRFESNMGDQNAPAVLGRFKIDICSRCRDRLPARSE
jgi:hypothetical protein